MSFLLVIIMLSLAVYVLLKQRPRKTELPESKDACAWADPVAAFTAAFMAPCPRGPRGAPRKTPPRQHS
jgi:hypothetical protein